MADWDALYYSNPMSLTNGIGGVVFTGADIPGFFNNPTPELLVRWYQAGVFQPFFRGHAHIDTKRREPYLVPEPYRSMTRAALRERYALLPYWYTLFYEATKTGTPMMRPMFMEFPNDEALFATEDQFMLGGGIMVKPVTKEGAVETDVYFAGNEVGDWKTLCGVVHSHKYIQPWYDLHTHESVRQLTGYQTVSAPLEKIPAYYRGGYIISRRERIRRSSHSMKLDPFTLVIALDKKVRKTLKYSKAAGRQAKSWYRARPKVHSTWMMERVTTTNLAHTSPWFLNTRTASWLRRISIQNLTARQPKPSVHRCIKSVLSVFTFLAPPSNQRRSK